MYRYVDQISMDDNSKPRPLGQQLLQTVAILQALTAIPIMAMMSQLVFVTLIFPTASVTFYYDFYTELVTALMATGIVFTVIVQNGAPGDAARTFIFEVIKTSLATALWLWLLLDALYGPWQEQMRVDEDLVAYARQLCIARAVTAAVLLPLLFYSALVASYVQWEQEMNRRNVLSCISLIDVDDMGFQSGEVQLTQVD